MPYLLSRKPRQACQQLYAKIHQEGAVALAGLVAMLLFTKGQPFANNVVGFTPASSLA